MRENSAFRARLRLSDPLSYSAGSLTALLAVFSTFLTVSASLWFWAFALSNPYFAGLNRVVAYAPFIWYAFLALLGYLGSRFFFGNRILQFIRKRRELAAFPALFIFLIVLVLLMYARFGLNYFSLALWTDFTAIIIMAPIAEEVFYRMFFLSVLVKATRQTVLPLILNAIIFALAHLSVAGGPSVLLLLAAIPFSIAVGSAFLYTKSLEVAIGLHFALNATGFLLGYLL